MPPETMGKGGTHYNTAIDIFSFGNVALFTVTQVFQDELLPANYYDSKTCMLIARTEIERRSQYFDILYEKIGKENFLSKLILQCLEYLPEDRPSATQVLDHLKEVQVNTIQEWDMTKLELIHSVEQARNQPPSFEEHQRQLAEKQAEIDEKQVLIDERQATIDAKQVLLDENRTIIDEMKALVDEKQATIDEKQTFIRETQTTISEKQTVINEMQATLHATTIENQATINELEAVIAQKEAIIDIKQCEIEQLKNLLQKQESFDDFHAELLQKQNDQAVTTNDGGAMTPVSLMPDTASRLKSQPVPSENAETELKKRPVHVVQVCVYY